MTDVADEWATRAVATPTPDWWRPTRTLTTWEQFERGVVDLVRKIDAYQREKGLRLSGIYAVPRGGLVLGVETDLGSGSFGGCCFPR